MTTPPLPQPTFLTLYPLPTIPPTPCIEFLDNNVAPPERQFAAILTSIRSAEDSMHAIDAELTRLKVVVDQYKQRRQELEEFARVHGAVVSSFRRVPPDVLGEIFRHALPVDGHGEKDLAILGKIGAVCRQWRNVAVNTPLLWCRVNVSLLPGALGDLFIPKQFRRAALNIERSTTAPLKIHINASERPLDGVAMVHKLFDLLLLENASRWKEVDLKITPNHLGYIATRGMSFSSVTSLCLSVSGRQRITHKSARFFASLVSLTELELGFHSSLTVNRQMGIPWAQLRSCIFVNWPLKKLLSTDVLPMLAPFCRLTLRRCRNGDSPFTSLLLRVSSLYIVKCSPEVVRRLLQISAMPHLKKLVIRKPWARQWAIFTDDRPFCDHAEQITQFLERSEHELHLTHLGIAFTSASSLPAFERLLKMPAVSSVSNLELFLPDGRRPFPLAAHAPHVALAHVPIQVHSKILNRLADNPELLPELGLLRLLVHSPFDGNILLRLTQHRQRRLRQIIIENASAMASSKFLTDIVPPETVTVLRKRGVKIALSRSAWADV
ncbi:F-box domain-containing protein [Mycena indigotica]|uniref:F-box domain-containing protein n=1 Tax=Mycena indigotica TaxID=2126181 RepID=A0A8H6WFB9_9AGAR|nr:F-box domain-containing protein [Mycena indigotica]KAF7312723.1 F-box domain-containing protein [Mycena indigotica]